MNAVAERRGGSGKRVWEAANGTLVTNRDFKKGKV